MELLASLHMQRCVSVGGMFRRKMKNWVACQIEREKKNSHAFKIGGIVLRLNAAH